MTKPRKYAKTFKVLASALVLTAGLSGYQQPIDAAVSVTVPETIRVALAMESSKLHAYLPAATFSSTGSLSVGIRSAAGNIPWMTLEAGKPIKSSLDQFRIELMETSDYTKAKAVHKSLTDAGTPAAVFKRSKQGKPLYQVTAGPYESVDAASAALTVLTKNAAFLAYAGTASIAGPQHLQAGSFAAEGEALKQQAVFNQAGIEADVVYQVNPAAPGIPIYSLWIGSETDAAKLTVLKQQVSALVPGYNLTPADLTLSYLIKREDVSAADPGTVHLLFGSSNEKLWLSSKDAKITVKEKGKSYRGDMELSQFGGKLAVVNELPFDQYLYSVVSSEMSTGWPQEALKAQAVAARTYALQAGNKYQIANVSDTTQDQAYGIQEYADVMKAVDFTKGELLADKNGLITPYYSSNSGGVTSELSEVWGSSSPNYKSVTSPDDGPAKSKPLWIRVVKEDGTTGYVPATSLKASDSPINGLPAYTTAQAVSLRSIPSSDNTLSPVSGQLAVGERVTEIGQARETNPYSWVRGPYTPAQLASKINTGLANPISAAIQTLEVGGKGPSGRATGLTINGTLYPIARPDSIRTMLNGLPSTLFEIEETGRYTILGANGTQANYPQTSGTPYVLQGSGQAAPLNAQALVMNGTGAVRSITKDVKFYFTGNGYGHGLGMSQYGAKALAEQGNDYRTILQHYYAGATILKE